MIDGKDKDPKIPEPTDEELNAIENEDLEFEDIFDIELDVANIDLTSEFTQTADSIMIRTGVASKDLNFTKTTIGDIKFVVVNASVTPETYTTITPSGTETYTEITPSGTETWTEIQ